MGCFFYLLFVKLCRYNIFRIGEVQMKSYNNIMKFLFFIICVTGIFGSAIAETETVVLDGYNTLKIEDNGRITLDGSLGTNRTGGRVCIEPLNQVHIDALKGLGFPEIKETNIPVIRGMMFLEKYFFDFSGIADSAINRVCNRPCDAGMQGAFNVEYEAAFDRLLAKRPAGSFVYAILVAGNAAGFIEIDSASEVNVFVHPLHRGNKASMIALITVLAYRSAKSPDAASLVLAIHPNNSAMKHVLVAAIKSKMLLLEGGWCDDALGAIDAMHNADTLLPILGGKPLKNIVELSQYFSPIVDAMGADGGSDGKKPIISGQKSYIVAVVKYNGEID
jgi:hypothetical protein